MFTDVEVFLINNLFNYVSFGKKNTFDEKYEFLKEKINKYLTREYLENVYYDIVNMYDLDSEYEAKRIIKNILYYYYLDNQNINEDINYLIEKFLDDEKFGISIIKKFYILIFKLEYVKKIENRLNKQKPSKYNEILYLKQKIESLNDKIRSSVQSLFLICIKYSNNLFDKATVNNAIKNSDDFIFLKNYYPYFVKLMYTDLYEYTLFDTDPEAKKINNMILKILNNQECDFNNPDLLKEEYLMLYMIILKDNMQRKENRKNLNGQNLKLVRKNNPLYMFDEF
ncbi:MAG: hypothetical protein ACI4XR_05605 [Bacilli bacterium]